MSKENKMEWNPSSWKSKKALQQPNYPDKEKLLEITKELSLQPPLVFAGEVRRLKKGLAEISAGKSFLLQGGDCAESFAEFNAPNVRDLFRVLLQMAVVLTYGGGMPIVKIGRMAGQFAKPRSSDMETQGDIELPSYRGDIINGLEFTKEARIPDPNRMLKAYHQSTSTLNLLRAFATGGYADLHKVNCWIFDFAKDNEQTMKYREVAKNISRTLDFMNACGINSKTAPALSGTSFYTSHEALLLPYEEALTRTDSTTGDYYDVSAHMLWIGDRTRDPNDAHIEFLRGVNNPIGIKCGLSMDPSDLIDLINRLNPKNEAGRITLIARMGADNIYEGLKPLIHIIKKHNKNVVWCIDPMHGNTEKVANNYKTRNFNKVLGEVRGFFDICLDEGVWPGGVHLEMTGRDVTECTGGISDVSEKNISECYETHCDPRLNASQSLEMAFLIAGQLKRAKKLYKFG